MRRLFIVHAVPLCLAASAPADPAADSWQSYRAHLAAAESALQLEHPGRAREWLDGAPREHRAWEWQYLDATLDTSLATLATLSDTVTSLSLSPDGLTLACGVSTGEIVLLTADSGAIIRRWPAHAPQGLFRVAFSPDGKSIASSGADRKACVWDAATGELRTTFDAHKFPVGGLAWSPDGSRIATSAYYMDKVPPITGRIHTWSPATGEIDKTMNFGVKPVVNLAWSRDGATLAAGTWDSHVWLFDPRTGAELRKCVEPPPETSDFHTDAVALSPDGSLLAAGSDEEWVRVYRTADCTRVAELLDHHADIHAVAFSPDGQTLATAGADCAIRLWSTSDWKPTATLRAHTAAVRAIAFNADGSRLYSGSADNTVRAWDTSHRDYAPPRLRHPKDSAGYSCGFSRDGSRIVGAAYDGTLVLWDSRTGAILASTNAHGESPVCHSEWSPDSTRIATCSWDKSLRIFNAADLAPLHTFTLDAGIAWCAFNPDGSRVIACLTNKTAVVLDSSRGDKLLTLEGHAGRVEQAAFSPDGVRIATISDTLRLFDAATGSLIASAEPATRGQTCAFSPDGAAIAIGTSSGQVRLHDARTAQHLRTLLEFHHPIYRVAFHPDGSRIAAAATDLFILDPARPGDALRLHPTSETLWDLCFSPDGHSLAAMAWNGEGVILRARPARAQRD